MNQPVLHPDPELNAQILQATPEVQRYIVALQTKVAELQAKVAEMQVQQITPQAGLVPARPKRAKKRGIHRDDMVELRKRMFGEKKARPEEETGQDSCSGS